VRMVVLEAMQLYNEPSLRLESLVLRTTVRTPAAVAFGPPFDLSALR
jgi:hypothetical protein